MEGVAVMGNAILVGRGAGGEYGTAGPQHVLAGYTVGTDDGLVAGAMPDVGAVDQLLANNGQAYTVPQGYHNGSGAVKAAITNLIAANVKQGATVGGVAGNYTNDADAAAGDLLNNKKAYAKGNLLTGSMINRGSPTFTPGAEQSIPAGYYSGGKISKIPDKYGVYRIETKSLSIGTKSGSGTSYTFDEELDTGLKVNEGNKFIFLRVTPPSSFSTTRGLNGDTTYSWNVKPQNPQELEYRDYDGLVTMREIWSQSSKVDTLSKTIKYYRYSVSTTISCTLTVLIKNNSVFYKISATITHPNSSALKNDCSLGSIKFFWIEG